MARDTIRLSPKHGVNASLMTCWWCGESYGVALLGMIGGYDKEAPHAGVYEFRPCPKCEEWMRKGIVLVGIDPVKSDPSKGLPGFYRTGHYTVVTEEAFRRIFDGEAAEFGLKHRWALVDQDVFVALGIDKGADSDKGAAIDKGADK